MDGLSYNSELFDSELQYADLYQKWCWDIQILTNSGLAWKIESGTHDVCIGLIDSGIDHSHPDLRPNILSEGRSFLPQDNSTYDKIGHGTMVAGVICARGRMLGLAPGIGVIPYRVFDGQSTDLNTVLLALQTAIEDNVDIINLSLGSYKNYSKESQGLFVEFRDLISKANNKGIIVVGSAGQIETFRSKQPEYYNLIHFPGDVPGVIPVVPIDKNNNVLALPRRTGVPYYACFGGDFGPLYASEGKINVRHLCLTTYPPALPQGFARMAGIDSGYEFMAGTSLAVGKVAAIVGLIQCRSLKVNQRKLNKIEICGILQECSARVKIRGYDIFTYISSLLS